MRAGDWAHVTLPAIGQWVYTRTRMAEAQPPPDPAGSPDTVSGPLPALIVPREGPLDARLEVFLHVLQAATGAYAAFVADDQGLPLATTAASDDSIAVTAAIDRALSPVRTTLRSNPLGSVALEIEGDNVLQAIWFRAGEERLVLGLVLPEPVGRDVVLQIRTSLSTLIQPSTPGDAP